MCSSVTSVLSPRTTRPDAIASAAAMSFLCKQKLDIDLPIYYSGIIGRAENIAVVDMLKDVHYRAPAPYETVNIALVDVQPPTWHPAPTSPPLLTSIT